MPSAPTFEKQQHHTGIFWGYFFTNGLAAPENPADDPKVSGLNSNLK